MSRLAAFILRHLEALAILAGGLLISIAAAAVDWRGGLAVAGVVLIASSIDWPGLRGRSRT